MNNNAMEKIETVSIDELRSVQLQRMKKTLQHAYCNSPVYKKKFDEAGVHPDDFKHQARPASRPWWAIRKMTSMSGQTWWRAHCAQLA